MARSGSENPKDVANLEGLGAELRGVLAEGERILALAKEQQQQATLEADRARADRKQAAAETKTRRKAVGTGGTPTTAALQGEPAVIEESTAATNRATAAEERRLSVVRERIREERLAATGAASRRDRFLPVLADPSGSQGFQLGQTPAQQIEAQGRLTQLRLEGITRESAAREQAAQRAAAWDERMRARNLQETLAAQRYARMQGTPLLLGPGQGGGTGFSHVPPPPPPPSGPPAPPGGPGEPPGGGGPVKLSEAINKTKELSSAEEALMARARAVTATEESLSRAIAYNSRVVGLSSNAYQKHGYLTSEFIQAAAKGQVTFRELSAQIGGTIAKFGGWTAAAGAVYGTLGAVAALGRGAIESSNGVQLLNRVIDQTKRGGIDDNALQGRVSDISRKFNVPIADANQAVYGSLKAFRGDLPEALKASEQALFAMKVGELDAADATKSLTAIVNGFQLTAKDLPLLFDTINQAQNKFGGNTGQMVQGIAKAGGAFRLAGGNYRELVAILQAGSRLTGRSPVEVATAVQRSAGRVLTQPGIEALRKAGLDPDQSYPKLLAQAAQLAKGASRERVQELARALIPSGGQFASTFAPLLQDMARNNGLYSKIFPELAPDKAGGSAARELARALREPQERLKQITGDLERLGVTLARLGAGAFPAALLKGLDLALNTTNEILKAINAIASLTGPFKPLTVGALEFAAVLRLIRRFDVGSSLPVGRDGSAYSLLRGGLQRPAVPRERAQILQGLTDEQKYIGEQRAQAAVSAAGLQTRLELQGQRVVKAVDAGIEQEIIREQRRYETIQTQYLEQQSLENTYRQQAVRVQGQINAVQAAKVKTMEELLAVTEAQGIAYTNPTLNRPLPVGPEAVAAQSRRAAAEAAAAGGLVSSAGPSGAPIILGPGSPGVPKVNISGQNFAGRGLNELERGVKNLGAAAASRGPIVRGAAGAVTLLGNAALFTGRAANAGAGALMTQARALYSTFGLVEKAFIGIGTAWAVYKNIAGNFKDANRVLDDLGSNDITRIRKTSEYRTPSVLSNLPIVGSHGFFGSVGGLFRNASDLAAKAIPGAQTSDDFKDDAQKAAAAEVAAFNKSREHRVNLYQGEILAGLKKNMALAGNDPAKQRAAIEQALKEQGQSFAMGAYGNRDTQRIAQENTKLIRAQLATIKSAQGEFAKAIQEINDAKGFDAFQKGIQARADLGLSGPGRSARALGFGIARARELFASGGMSAEEAAAAESGAADAQQKLLEDQLNQRLAMRTSPRGRAAARQDFIEQLRTQRLGPMRAEIARLEAESKALPEKAAENNKTIRELRRGIAKQSRDIEATIREQHS
ncbi:MAG TPA: phage tail tape measure protein, partial [Casimicrobiaceae bacterium]